MKRAGTIAAALRQIMLNPLRRRNSATTPHGQCPPTRLGLAPARLAHWLYQLGAALISASQPLALPPLPPSHHPCGRLQGPAGALARGRATVFKLRWNSSCFVFSWSTACWWETFASWVWPSAARICACAITIEASISAIWRRAVSTAASCFELSSSKIGYPLFTLSRNLPANEACTH